MGRKWVSVKDGLPDEWVKVKIRMANGVTISPTYIIRHDDSYVWFLPEDIDPKLIVEWRKLK